MGVPQNAGFIRENPIEMDDTGVPPIPGNLHIEMVRNFIPPQPDIDMEIPGLSKENDLRSRCILVFPYLC